MSVNMQITFMIFICNGVPWAAWVDRMDNERFTWGPGRSPELQEPWALKHC